MQLPSWSCHLAFFSSRLGCSTAWAALCTHKQEPSAKMFPKNNKSPRGAERIHAHQTPIRQQELGASGPRRASRCNATFSTGMAAVGWRGYVAWGRRSKSTASSKGTHGRGAAALHLCPYHRWTRWTPQVTDQCQFLLHRKVWQRFPQASTL